MNLLKTLDQIGTECGTDKSSRFHGYLDYYHYLLSPIRHQAISMVEIGVAGGESIRMWSEFFTNPESRIYGVDIHNLGGELGRGKFFHADATQPNSVFDITNVTGSLDLIIDDAGHYSDEQKKLLELWWPHLKPRGIWITEDLHCSYRYPWTEPGNQSFVSYLSGWIDRVHEKGEGERGTPISTDVEEIVLRKSLVVIKKR